MQATVSPIQRTRSKARDPRTVQLSPRNDRGFDALSSDGVTVYTVHYQNGAWRCTCKGYAARETCCHSIAAAICTCWGCGSTIDVALHWNGWDNAEIALCAACCSPKEAA